MTRSAIQRRAPLRSRPKPPEPKERVRPPVKPLQNCRGIYRHVGNAAPVAVPKEHYFHSEAWRRAVASLPCVLCGKHDETQCAHRNEGKAGGKKLMDDCWTAALCVTCHGAIDQGKDFDREERRARMDLAILLTLRELARQGRVRVA